MRNKYLHLRYIILFIAAWGASACTSFVESYEIDPNRPQKATVQTILSSTEVHTFNLYSGNLARITSIFMQSQAGLDRQYAAHGTYKLSESDVDNDWTIAYSGGLIDAEQLIKQATEEEKPHYVGLGKILKAMQIGYVSACWGDVPYKEAFLGDKNRNPRYDPQESVYQNVQILLDEGISLLKGDAGESTEGVVATDDIIHKGDMNRWIGTAYILKARYYNHLSKRDPSGSALSALAALDSAYLYQSSSAGDAMALFGSDAINNNFWYQFATQRGDLGMGKFIVDTMLTLEDPRLSIYATTDENDEYSGYPPGGDSDIDPFGVSYLGDYFSGPAAPAGMVTFVEAKFIEAECAYRLGNNAKAAAAFQAGLQTALALPGIGDVSSYLNAELSKPLTLERIMFQKYMALFTQTECWNDYRRTGFPKLKHAPGLTDANFPRRFPTALSERQNNANAPVITSNTTPRVWWDQ